MALPGFTAESCLGSQTARHISWARADSVVDAITAQDAVYQRADPQQECFPVTVNGNVTICCCDANGDNCACTGIV